MALTRDQARSTLKLLSETLKPANSTVELRTLVYSAIDAFDRDDLRRAGELVTRAANEMFEVLHECEVPRRCARVHPLQANELATDAHWLFLELRDGFFAPASRR